MRGSRSYKYFAPTALMTRLLFIFEILVLACLPVQAQQTTFNVAAFDRARVLKAAEQYLSEKPITITASHSSRSAGGVHDFFSEGDYWWPDPQNPNGPYVRRDGETNPENFVAHRDAMRRLSLFFFKQKTAYEISGDQR